MTKNEILESLPESVQTEVKETLKAYNECFVTFENGKYSALPAIGIKAKYAEDHKFIGKIKSTDIYTLEERKQNYRDMFGSEPYGMK